MSTQPYHRTHWDICDTCHEEFPTEEATTCLDCLHKKYARAQYLKKHPKKINTIKTDPISSEYKPFEVR